MNSTDHIVPKPVLIGRIWPGLGIQIHIRVRIRDQYLYTSRIQKKGQSLVELVKETRREFRRVAA